MELLTDVNEKLYIDLIIDLRGERPLWVAPLSDRAAFSLVREGFNSVDELKAAVDAGLKLSDISNFGRKEVKETELLLR